MKQTSEQNLWPEDIFIHEVLSGLPFFFFCVDTCGKVLSCGGEQIRLLGKSKSDIEGKSIHEIFAYTPTIISQFRQTLEKEKVLCSIFDIGGILLEVITKPLRSNNVFKGVSLICTDVTVYENMQNQLRESEERFRRLCEASFEGIAILENTRIIDANPAISQMLGYKSWETLGLDFLNLIHKDDLSQVQSVLENYFEESFELLLIKKDGSSFHAEICFRNYKIRDEGISRVVAIRDITMRKIANDELCKKQILLEKANEDLLLLNQKLSQTIKSLEQIQKGKLLMEKQLLQAEKFSTLGMIASGVAHEIAQPLNALTITVDGLEFWFNQGKIPDPQTIREKLKRVSSQSTRINEILTHMKSLYREQENPSLRAVDLIACTERALKLTGQKLLNHHIQVDFSKPKQACFVKANPIQMEQILIHLFSYLQIRLEVKPENLRNIMIFIKESGEWVFLDLEINDGGGPDLLPEDLQEMVSMGPGLAIVHTFVNSWDGKLQNISEEKKKGIQIQLYNAKNIKENS